jgi:hypothetical protein
MAALDLVGGGWERHRAAPRPAQRRHRVRAPAGARPAGRSAPPACGGGSPAGPARSGAEASRTEAWRCRCSHRASASRAVWPTRGVSLNGERSSDVPMGVDGAVDQRG